MSEHSPNYPNAPKAGASHAARKLSCEEWEALLVDFLDGTLPPGDSDSFQAHPQGCSSCAEILSQSGQGREWLSYLRVEPKISPVLVSKILAQTSGSARMAAVEGNAAPVSAAVIPVAPLPPFWKRSGMAIAGHRVAQPRMMMTAAMAFFSITLTLNMAGVRLGAVRLADLKPTAVSSNLNKQYHMASARVVRYYDNLRFVYEMEARVKELRQDSNIDNSVPAVGPAGKPDQPSSPPAPRDGSHKSGGKSEGPNVPQPRPMVWGEKIVASLEKLVSPLDAPVSSGAVTTASNLKPENDRNNRAADQAERGNA